MLGRKTESDPRSRNYQMADELSHRDLPGATSKTWRRPQATDQGMTPWCVEHATLGMVNCQPNTEAVDVDVRNEVVAGDGDIMRIAQTIDPWPGEDYDGTSCLAGMKAAKSLDLLGGRPYLWAYDLGTVISWLSHKGPVQFGTDWYYSMFNGVDVRDPGYYPNKLLVDPTSGVAGGHAFCVHGVDVERQLLIATNSWGTEWGDDGRFYLDFADADYLLSNNGEAVTIGGRKFQKEAQSEGLW